jgi:Right handed beta helix region
MILEKRPRALICAGFFCLAGALGSAAQAAEVYPGCAQPGPTGKVWYLDPVNGKTPAAGGNGSQTAPWNSLQGVLSFRLSPGYTRPLLSSVPYYHVVDGKRSYVADQLGSPPIQPGDTIMLMNGNYGDIGIGDYMQQVVNPSFVTVEAAPGQTPVFSTLYIRSTNKWVFNGVEVQSLLGTNNNKQALVTVTDQGAAHPTSDIILENMQISTLDDATNWTKAQWQAQGRSGFREVGGVGNGTNGQPSTTCISMTGSKIRNVRFGAALFGNKSLFQNNDLGYFGDDGIDYGANFLTIAHNYIHDNFDIADANHEDAMQGQNGPLPPGVVFNRFSDILIDSNLVIRQTDPKLAFPTYLQGIDAFDEDWTNLTVTNNVIATSACWGIGYASLHHSKIINNTVVDDGTDAGTKNPAGNVVCRPLTSVGDKTHQGPTSSGVIIRNNIASGLGIYDVNPDMTMDHNICVTIDRKCNILRYVGGKPKWGVYKPGEYADHNIIDRFGASSMFVSFDPAKFLYDLRLKPGAPAIGAGNPAEAPAVDITGAPRASPIDAGAYQHSSGK